MPINGNSDASTNAVAHVAMQLNLAPNSANRDALYLNATADAFVPGQTIGMYAIDDTEISVGAQKLASFALTNTGTSGSYVPGEVLTLDETGSTSEAEATIIVNTTAVRTAAVGAGGTGYANGDTVRLNTGAGANLGVFTVTTGASDDIVASVAVTNAGSFTTNPTLSTGNTTALTGNGSGLTLTVTMRIGSASIGNPGNYTVLPTALAENDLAGSASGNGAVAALGFNAGSKGVAHTGWILRTVGSGGRAGRVQTEVLVAGGIITDNDDDDTVLPDA